MNFADARRDPQLGISSASRGSLKTRQAAWAAVCLGFAAAGLSGESIRAAPAAANPAPLSIPLYESRLQGAPVAGSKTAQPEIDEQLGGNHVLRNVTDPNLTVFLPEPAKNTGTGVIIAPGGGFMMLSIDYEGRHVARWLAARGVAAFVLKYRLEETPANDLLFDAVLIKRLYGAQHRSGVDLPRFAGEALGVEDGFQAMRLVKRRAAEWRLDPNRIGFLGFSAGAIIALHLAGDYDTATRPAFVAPIYGLKTFAHPIRSDAPPLFIAIASDDPIFPAGATDLYCAWRKAGVAAELHVYDQGGHGFGMKPGNTTSSHWIDEFAWWLYGQKLMTPAAH
jgi:acetyl esterase/lipase